MLTTRARSALIAIALCTAALGCEDDDTSTGTRNDAITDAGRRDDGGALDASARADAGMNDAGVANGDGGDAGEVDDAGDADDAGFELSDGQILTVMFLANLGEITQARVALPHLSRAEARALAMSMELEHTAALQRQRTLARQQGIRPQPSALSRALAKEAFIVLRALSTMRGEQANLAYARLQVAVHAELLGLIEHALIPSVEDPTLLAELERSRLDVAAHLQTARDVVDVLE